MEEILGIISDIIYHNDRNGYTIATAENEETLEQFTVVGCLPAPDRGRRFAFAGKWKTHPSYGLQFAFESYREELPKTVSGIENFLSSGLMKGIGKKTAASIVSRFGEDTFRVIEEEPHRLTEVDGVGDVKAASIKDAFTSHGEFAKIVLYLQQYGISTGYALKLYKAYGKDTIASIEENPYRMVDDIFGIGFRKADRIAAKLGIDPNSGNRIRSGIRYALSIFINEGHTFVPQKKFCESAGELMDVGSEEVYEAVVEMAFEGELKVESIEGRAVIYPMVFYIAEKNVGMKLVELAKTSKKHINTDVEKLIDFSEKQSGIKLSENQKSAVRACLENGVTIVTGGPGTGKTTIINTILTLLHHSGLRTSIAAPTGRAAKRITETTGYSASTIHRLLEYFYAEGDDVMRFGRNKENPLDTDVVIIDECSMIDILLMKGLLDAVSFDTRLILVGDADQLSSVGPGNVLLDIQRSDIIPSVKLTEIFRQAKESLIVVNAHSINKGEYPYYNERDKDFFLLHRKTENEMLSVIVDLCTRRLPQYFSGCDTLLDVQVLTPVRRGTVGSVNLNKELQAVLNAPTGAKKERRFGERLFREGDKVMQIKNNYQLEWRRTEDFSDGRGVFNGDCGFIKTIDIEFNEMTVVFEDSKYVKYDFSQIDELELAYAITVHKSQGSEFPIIIMPISYFPPMLATRNLLYTAVTRAREVVVLVGSENKMRQMVDNNRIIERYSGLSSMLKEYLAWDGI